MDLLTGANVNIDLFANASLFLPEENPEAIEILKKKAADGTKVRIMLADPDHPAAELRGREERFFDGIPGRIKMAWAYYSPLIGLDGIEFRMHGDVAVQLDLPLRQPDAGQPAHLRRVWLHRSDTARAPSCRRRPVRDLHEEL